MRVVSKQNEAKQTKILYIKWKRKTGNMSLRKHENYQEDTNTMK